MYVCISVKLGSTNNVDTVRLDIFIKVRTQDFTISFIQVRTQNFIIICVILSGVCHFVWNTKISEVPSKTQDSTVMCCFKWCLSIITVFLFLFIIT